MVSSLRILSNQAEHVKREYEKQVSLCFLQYTLTSYFVLASLKSSIYMEEK